MEVLVTAEGFTTRLAAESDKSEVRVLEFKSVDTVNVCRHEELMDEFKQCRAEEVKVWKDTSLENADRLIYDVKVAKVDIVKMSVECNLILARFEEHVCAQQAPVHANVERKASLTGAMANMREQFESGR